MGILTAYYGINLYRQETVCCSFFCSGFQECNLSVKQGHTGMGNVRNEHNSAYSEVVALSTQRLYIYKIQQDTTVCRYLFTAKSLYMFRASIAPIVRST